MLILPLFILSGVGTAWVVELMKKVGTVVLLFIIISILVTKVAIYVC